MPATPEVLQGRAYASRENRADPEDDFPLTFGELQDLTFADIGTNGTVASAESGLASATASAETLVSSSTASAESLVASSTAERETLVS